MLQNEGAGAWINAFPNKAVGTKVSPQLFRPIIQRQLRMPIYDEEDFCRACDTVMDIYGDHALTCACWGDRTKRHNMIRNVGVRLATSAGWRPEPEKAGLLRPRPVTEVGTSMGGFDSSPEARRPADIYIPRWDLGGSAALDFAVTSGLRNDMLLRSANDGSACLSIYENYKITYLKTAETCAENGITFVPMVIEAYSGGWGPAATKVWRRLGRAISLISGESSAVEALRVKQNLGLAIKRKTARAVLRRFPQPKEAQDRGAARSLLCSENTLREEVDGDSMEF